MSAFCIYVPSALVTDFSLIFERHAGAQVEGRGAFGRVGPTVRRTVLVIGNVFIFFTSLAGKIHDVRGVRLPIPVGRPGRGVRCVIVSPPRAAW